MSYQHIENLYKDQRILLFREAFALEKIHGTSAHVAWRDGHVKLSSGGASAALFASFFDTPKLAAAFGALGHPAVTVYGEAYGGKQQGQKWRYGSVLRFVSFEVKIDEFWLAVPQAADVVEKLGLEFVHYKKVPTDLDALDAERDAPSEQARRNGVVGDVPREGIVLRPLIELVGNDGYRIVCKHKRDEERETATPRKVVDPAQLAVLTRATEIADEWVTPTRLAHVLGKLEMGGVAATFERMREVIDAMVEDVVREAKGEIVDSKEARTAIGRKTAQVFKLRLEAQKKEVDEDAGSAAPDDDKNLIPVKHVPGVGLVDAKEE